MFPQKNNLQPRSKQLNKLHSQQGFGIIEVVISLFIIGVALLLFQVVSQTVVLNKYNEYREVALRAAESQMQTLKTTPYASLPDSSSFSNSQITSLPSGSGAYQVEELEEGLSRIQVTVQWRNSTGAEFQEIMLESYASDGGLGK